MEISQIIPHIEALIFASEKPLTSAELTELVNNAMGFIEDRATQEQVDAAIEGICEKYNADFYAFEVKESGGGWQFLTKKDYYKTVGQLNGDKFLKRLSNAALETLAIIAYKQPITKSEIEAIRGVNCDYAVQKLLEKDLIIISGRREDAVGHPLIYSTSKSFMDYFGINSADELPKISEVMMEELVAATMVKSTEEQVEVVEDVATNNTDAGIENPAEDLISSDGEALAEPIIETAETEVIADTPEPEEAEQVTISHEDNAAAETDTNT
jgi:segregation and condensation protein B